jgi:hypothetical protein
MLQTTKMRVCWDIGSAPCSFVDVKRRFTGAYNSIIALLSQAAHTSETSVCFNETTRSYYPRNCPHTRRRENVETLAN